MAINMKKSVTFLLGIFFIVAGINHFDSQVKFL